MKGRGGKRSAREVIIALGVVFSRQQILNDTNWNVNLVLEKNQSHIWRMTFRIDRVIHMCGGIFTQR